MSLDCSTTLSALSARSLSWELARKGKASSQQMIGIRFIMLPVFDASVLLAIPFQFIYLFLQLNYIQSQLLNLL
jgi:hypothetical protein